MKYGRFHWTVLGAALGSVLAVELARRYLDAGLWWLWPVVLMTGVLVFTRVVFAKMTALNRTAQSHELRAERLFSSAAVGMVLVSNGCRIQRMNPAAERLTGWKSHELVGKSFCSDLFAPGTDGKPICFEACLKMPNACPDPVTNMTLQTKHGRRLAVSVCVTTLQEDEFYLFFWDISERTRLERELARRRRQAESLYQVGREMAAMVDLDRNLERLLDKAREVMDAGFAGWGTLDETTQELTWHVVVGASAHFARSPLPLKGTVVGRVLLAGRPYVTQDLRTDLQESDRAAHVVAAEQLQAAMAVPLQVRDRHYGVLFVAHRQAVRMSDEDLLLLSNLGSHMGIAVENNDLLRRMQQVAALEERQRLARDMHDSFGQILTYVGMRLHLLAGMARERQAGEMLEEITDLHSTLNEAHQDVRRSIYQLKESGPALAPLWDRWTETLRQFHQQTGIAVEMTGHEAVPAHLPDQAESQMTRVIQEALVNVRNHSGAGHVWLTAYRDGANLVVAVQDDGCGFEPEGAAGPGEYHFGLNIMRERIESVGGSLAITSEVGRGTEVRLTVPTTEGGGNDHVTAQSAAGR